MNIPPSSSQTPPDPLVTVETCKETLPHAGHWYEVAVALDADDEPHVVQTDGMYDTAAEAQAAGEAWVASEKGQAEIAAVVAAKRRLVRQVLDRLLSRIPEPDADDEDQ